MKPEVRVVPASPSILVVDDMPANLGVLLEFLSGYGLRVLVAESGAGALEQVGYFLPDIILLDVIMPGLDGLTVCRRLKGNPATAAIPVLFMTALSDTVDKVAGFAAGAVDYVTKPVEPQEVLARLRAHLEIRRLQVELESRNRDLSREILLRREAEDQLQESLDQAVIVCGEAHGIRFCTRRAWQLLERYFGPDASAALPSPLCEWIDSGSSAVPYIREEPGARLTVRRFTERGPTGTIVLLLEEKIDLSGPELLLKLGLTAREAEVLYWLTQGKTSHEIGVILGAALNTIKKHVQNVFQKLGVENRTAAAVRALEVLRLGESGS